MVIKVLYQLTCPSRDRMHTKNGCRTRDAIIQLVVYLCLQYVYRSGFMKMHQAFDTLTFLFIRCNALNATLICHNYRHCWQRQNVTDVTRLILISDEGYVNTLPDKLLNTSPSAIKSGRTHLHIYTNIHTYLHRKGSDSTFARWYKFLRMMKCLPSPVCRARICFTLFFITFLCKTVELGVCTSVTISIGSHVHVRSTYAFP